MEYHKRYLDAHTSEHMYNASQIIVYFGESPPPLFRAKLVTNLITG